MHRAVLIAALITGAALILAWLAVWPIGTVNCDDDPTPLLRICEQSSALGIRLGVGSSPVPALATLCTIASAGAIACGITAWRFGRKP